MERYFPSGAEKGTEGREVGVTFLQGALNNLCFDAG